MQILHQNIYCESQRNNFLTEKSFKNVEKIDFNCKDEQEKDVSKEKLTKQLSIPTSFSMKKDPEFVLARVVALDCIPFSKLAISIDIQNGWLAQGLKIPSSNNGMKNMCLVC